MNETKVIMRRNPRPCKGDRARRNGGGGGASPGRAGGGGTIGDRKTSQYNGTMGDNAMALGLMNARLGGGDIGEGEIWSR